LTRGYASRLAPEGRDGQRRGARLDRYGDGQAADRGWRRKPYSHGSCRNR
jgi:hypothetical protein